VPRGERGGKNPDSLFLLKYQASYSICAYLHGSAERGRRGTCFWASESDMDIDYHKPISVERGGSVWHKGMIRDVTEK
jgi:hypothetical protein